MSVSSKKWNLTILAAHSQKWSQRLADEFQAGVSSLLEHVEEQMRTEHPSLQLSPLHFAASSLSQSEEVLRERFTYAIFDVTDWDEDLAFLIGGVHGARIPYVKVCKSESGTQAQRQNTSGVNLIPYYDMADLFRSNSLLQESILQAISPASILEQLVYELWFPRD